MIIDPDGGEELELTEAQVADEGGEPEIQAEEQQPEEDEADEVVISFGDEPEEGEEEPALVKKLRAELRERDRKLAQFRKAPASAEDDPEPTIPSRPSLEAVDYDQDRFDAALEARENAIQEHAEWKVRQGQRQRELERASEEQAKAVEQKIKSLGVSRDEYLRRANRVREVLNEQQLAVLINAAENEAKILFALGSDRSSSVLDDLAATENLAKLAAKVGKLEPMIKMSKRKAPPPESRVRGATASTAITNDDKHLEQLEREADRTGDRSKVIAYKRQQRQQQAA